MKRTAVAIIALFLLAMLPARGGDQRADELIRKMDEAMRGLDSSRGTYTMIIEKARWKKPRTIKMKSWEIREKENEKGKGKEPGKSFILITEPASESGKAFLKIGNQMWSYFPEVNAVTKIPESMMLQDWMGSDFTNDDLVQESSVINDYTHKIVKVYKKDGVEIDVIEVVPKPDAPVTWGKIIVEVRDSDAMPLRQEFYNEKSALVRVMTFEDIKTIAGRTMPTKWIVKPEGKPGDRTVFIVSEIEFNVKIDPKIFTLARLRQGGL